MYVETVDDLVNQLADWLHVYGCCKHAENDEDCHEENPMCCRVGFSMVMADRIRQAVHNDNMLEELAIKTIK
jgi:hypothetical protein